MGISSKVERLSYTQLTVEHYHYPQPNDALAEQFMRSSAGNLKLSEYMKYCEKCHKEIIQLWGSGRFCSEHCARSFSASVKRKETNKKVSETLRNKWKFDKEYINKTSEARVKQLKELHKKNHEKHLKRNVSIDCKEERIELDITYGELEEYRKSHQVCEICGRKEICITGNKRTPNKLSIDHNHSTNKFRGLLCFRCNRDLGWFEKYREQIIQYCDKGI